MEFAKSYDPSQVEERWYRWWLEKGYFVAPSRPEAEPFSIVIPPPNVTGSLHIGHAFNNTLQDVLVRFHRMEGRAVLWVPGTDHAGIATQLMVERSLERESLSRADLGREAFIEKVWEWKRVHGGMIMGQLRRLGASLDWTRERFTLDEGLSRAVRRVFVDLWREGYIYRDKRLVNWDPSLRTAISDLEVQQREEKGYLWYIRYPVEGEPGRFITVATTRPETMLGDTAVAVHPDDDRYRDLVGRRVVVPIVDRAVPVIADPYTDPEKGTGAVKITPAHDFNDFEVGRRHGLPLINIFDESARLNDNVPARYRGLERYEARRRVVEELRARGLLEKVEEHLHAVPYGDRSGVVIEPWLVDQWYVDAPRLAPPAIEAVESGRIRFIPSRWENTYFEWMRNIQPWCVSRQIWWGHRIPAWYGPDGKVFVAMSADEAHAQARKHYGRPVELRMDEDVLDTWFSSALWPFSTLGWPEQTEELRHYYPTSVLVTGFDIIFFWVARMIMMGLKFMGDVPFREVYIHGLIRDEKGEKMSKTKGNVIDPVDVMDRFGADSLRFTLTALATQGRDIKLSVPVIEGYRNFMNKIWNAARFVALNMEGFDPKAPSPAPDTLSLVDKWILTRFNRTVAEWREAVERYEFDRLARAVYQFIWGEYCDWYIEFSKSALQGGDPEARRTAQWVLGTVLLRSLQLLHPLAPFITEEIYQRIRTLCGPLEAARGGQAESIVVSRFPVVDPSLDYEEACRVVEFAKEVVVAVRNLRASVGVHPAREVDVVLVVEGPEARERVEATASLIRELAKVGGLTMAPAGEKPQKAVSQVVGDVEVWMSVEGVIDVAKEMARMGREMEKIDADLARTRAKLENKNFIERAPREVVEKERRRLDELLARRKKVEEVVSRLKGLESTV